MLTANKIIINTTKNKMLRVYVCGFGAVSTEEEIIRGIEPHLLGPIAVENLIFYWSKLKDSINIIEL